MQESIVGVTVMELGKYQAELMRVGYFAVRWGHQTRLSTDRDNAGGACKQCYGMVAESMEVCFISNRLSQVRTAKFRNQRVGDAANWSKIPEQFLDNLGRLTRRNHV